MPFDSKRADYGDIYCPYCGDFYGFITDKSWMFEGTNKEVQVHCMSAKCGLPFMIVKK